MKHELVNKFWFYNDILQHVQKKLFIYDPRTWIGTVDTEIEVKQLGWRQEMGKPCLVPAEAGKFVGHRSVQFFYTLVRPHSCERSFPSLLDNKCNCTHLEVQGMNAAVSKLFGCHAMEILEAVLDAWLCITEYPSKTIWFYHWLQNNWRYPWAPHTARELQEKTDRVHREFIDLEKAFSYSKYSTISFGTHSGHMTLLKHLYEECNIVISAVRHPVPYDYNSEL